MPSETILIGYLPKRIVDMTGDVDAPRYPGVEEICSVSECFSKSPPEWEKCWLHNTDTRLFDDPGAAWWVVPEVERERYRLYAYRLLPTPGTQGRTDPASLHADRLRRGRAVRRRRP